MTRTEDRVSPTRALELDVSENIAALSGYLRQEHVAHRVFEEQGRQIVEVARAEDAVRVVSLYRAWRSGAFQLLPVAQPVRAPAHARWLGVMRRNPVLSALLVVAVVLFPATWTLDAGRLGPVFPWLTFVSVEFLDGRLVTGTLMDAMRRGEVWRLISPIFLHFSFAHLAFNAAAVGAFGRRIEKGAGSGWLAFVVVLCGMSSNMVQFLWNAMPLFGGLSGVAYGLFGYVVVRGRLEPDSAIWQVSNAFVIGMLVILLAMSTGITGVFDLHIANAAHWSGLATGAALGALSARVRRA